MKQRRQFLRHALTTSHFIHDVLERSVVDSGIWLEQNFDATDTFGTDSDDVSVWELVGLFLVNFRSRFEICVVI